MKYFINIGCSTPEKVFEQPVCDWVLKHCSITHLPEYIWKTHPLSESLSLYFFLSDVTEDN